MGGLRLRVGGTGRPLRVMGSDLILLLLLTITAAGFVFGAVLELLNLRSARPDIPDEVAAIYDREKYLRSVAYHREKTRFDLLTSGIGVAVSLAMLGGGGFGFLDGLLRPHVTSPVALTLVYFAVLILLSDLFTLPFQWYATFVIEEKYGFNKTTVKTFITDKIKGYILGGLIGGLLLTALLLLMERLGPNFWIWFGAVAGLFILFMNLFYTTWILPLFNKLTPLPEGELKSAIDSFARQVSFPLDSVYVMDGSRRSSKANAFFSGMGRRKKIVLFDTLLEKHTTEELVAVLAHEVGHYKKKHVVVGYLLSLVQIFFMLFVLSRMVFSPELSVAMGGASFAVHLNLLAFGILFSPISGVTGLLMSLYSRRNEYQADAYARENYSGPALASALKKLSVDSLSNLYPHPAYVFFHYSHPPLLRRLQALRANA